MTKSSKVPFSVSSAGAVAATRYVGGTTSGAPTTGTFVVGDFAVAQNGHLFVCTVGGNPGTWADAGASGTTDAASLHYQAGWLSTKTYAVNDVVADAAGLYVALLPVPSGVSREPVLNPVLTTTTASTVTGANTPIVNDETNAFSVYQTFTTGPSAFQVDSVTAYFYLNTSAGTFRMGIASSVGTSDSSVIWVGATPPISNNPAIAGSAAAPTAVVSALPVITLQANTTYYFVVDYISGVGATGVAEDTGGSRVLSGGIASIGIDGYANNGAWLGSFGRTYKFSLASGTLIQPYWQKIAVSIDPTSVHHQGGWAGTKTYAVNDTVSDSYGLHVALTAVPSGAVYQPGLSPTSILVGANDSGVGGNNANFLYDPFTVSAALSGIVAVSIQLATAGTGSVQVGIATAIGANPGSITWLGAAPAITILQAAVGDQIFALPAALSLAASTTYYIVVNQVSGGGANPVGLATSTVQSNPTVGINFGVFGYSSAAATAWTLGVAGYSMNVQLLSSLTKAYWQKIAVTSPPVIVSVTSATTVATNTIYLANGTFVMTVPVAAGLQATIKNTGTGTITVSPASGTIDGSASAVLSPYVSINVVSDGTNVWVV